MDDALRVLTDGLVDDAGTFAPKGLEPGAALARHRAMLAGSEARMLRALAWPVARLDALVGPFPTTLIGSGSEDWRAARQADAAAIAAYYAGGGETTIIGYECALDPAVPLARSLATLATFAEGDVYVELSGIDDLSEAIAALSEHDWASAKLRTGGDASASSERLARLIADCVGLEVPFKLTAGLHAPFSSDGAFGFLNALVATSLAISDDLSPREIEAILVSPREAFRLAPLAHRGRTISSDEAEDARAHFDAIGSCDLPEMSAVLESLVLESL